MQYKLNKKSFHRVKTSIICHVLIMAMISGLFANLFSMEIYGYTEQKGVVTGITTTLNVRSGPGTTYSIVASLTNNYVVTVQGKEYASGGAEWYKISFVNTNGKTIQGYVYKGYIDVTKDVEYEPDADFEKYLTAQKFPDSYKESLRILHDKYPEWVFLADKINYEWDDVVREQSKVIKKNKDEIESKSLVTKNAISSWKSLEKEAYNWEKGEWFFLESNSWVAASKEIVAYYLDPRNFLNDTYIFQFTSLAYNSTYETRANLSSLVNGSFLASDGIEDDDTGKFTSYVDILLKVAKKTGVSAFYLASSIIQEIGNTGTSGSILGEYLGYEGIYNYFNWGANSGAYPISNALSFASKTDPDSLRPWNTRYRSILGGAMLFNRGYIDVGQDTMYYKKFDFVGTPYTHQYMTNIQAGANEGRKIGAGYSEKVKVNSALEFKIPIFNNMPDTAVKIPTGDGSPNSCLKSLTISSGSLTPTFSYYEHEYDVIVKNSVESININAELFVNSSTVDGTGKHSLKVGNNTIKVEVIAENGDVREYKINVVRQEASGGSQGGEDPSGEDPSGETPTPIFTVNGYKVDETNKYITGIPPGVKSENFISNIKVTYGSVKILDSNGSTKTGNVGTGNKVVIYDNDGEVIHEYKCVVTADANGDGEVTVKDALLVRKHIMNTQKINDIYFNAADANGDGKVTVKDALIIRKHIMGTSVIK